MRISGPTRSIALVAFLATAALSVPPAHAAGPMVGHGLTPERALSGWISLFDGETDLGWEEASVAQGILRDGQTTVPFLDGEIEVEVLEPGALQVGDKVFPLAPGKHALRITGVRGPLGLTDGLAIRSLVLRPLGLQPLFDGKTLSGWVPVLPREGTSNVRPPWSVDAGKLVANGGPSVLRHQRTLDDFVLQVDVRALGERPAGSLLFRCSTDSDDAGYAVLLAHPLAEDSSLEPGWTTGAIAGQAVARHAVPSNTTSFRLTVLMHGPRLATWVNGEQQVAWTDRRPPHDDPREGCRTKPGSIQLRVPHAKSTLELQNIRYAAFQ